jgi:hypothetical protein
MKIFGSQNASAKEMKNGGRLCLDGAVQQREIRLVG